MLELYHFWDSTCSFKVRLCLAEKGVAWTGRHVDLMKFENLRPKYLGVNPKGVVPTLVHDGEIVGESSIINEYLDDVFTNPPLKPSDPLARARMRLWVKHEEDELFIAVRPASLNLLFKQILGSYTEEELDEFLRHHPRQDRVDFLKKTFKAPYDAQAVEGSRRMLDAAFARMEGVLSEHAWLAGEAYSLADIAAAPVIDRVERLGMADIWAERPAVKGWIERLTSRPAYGEAKPRDKYRI